MADTDPNPITDPTGGAPNFDIEAVFQSFGMEPTQAQIDALAPAFEGGKNVAQTGDSAVANFVQAYQQINGAQSLIQGQLQGTQAAETAAQGASTADYAAGTASYNQAQQTLEAAPQLFGSMNPSQVSQYLAPLQNQFNYGLGQITGQAAQRGLAGSSLEAQAMAQAQTQYQQSVLSQGLSIGQQQQQLLAQSQQALGSQQFGAGGQQLQAALGYGGQASGLLGQNMNAATTLAGLPGGAVAQSLAQQALLQQMNPQTQSFGQKILGGLENVGVQGITNLGTNLLNGLIPQTQAGNTSGIGSLSNLTSLLGGGLPQGGAISPTGASLTGSAGGMGPASATAGLDALA
jgi:hypothetical protein